VVNDQKFLSSMISKLGTKFKLLTILVILSSVSFSGYTQETVGIIGQIEQFHPEMGKVSIKQDPRITQLMNAYYIQNASRPGLQGFRLRIFFDLGQQSRTNSLEVMNQFMEDFPGIPVYRTFDSPYYKVSVGDFRSRDEALKLHQRISRRYPKAFIVPEWINFPRID